MGRLCGSGNILLGAADSIMDHAKCEEDAKATCDGAKAKCAAAADKQESEGTEEQVPHELQTISWDSRKGKIEPCPTGQRCKLEVLFFGPDPGGLKEHRRQLNAYKDKGRVVEVECTGYMACHGVVFDEGWSALRRVLCSTTDVEEGVSTGQQCQGARFHAPKLSEVVCQATYQTYTHTSARVKSNSHHIGVCEYAQFTAASLKKVTCKGMSCAGAIFCQEFTFQVPGGKKVSSNDTQALHAEICDSVNFRPSGPYVVDSNNHHNYGHQIRSVPQGSPDNSDLSKMATLMCSKPLGNLQELRCLGGVTTHHTDGTCAGARVMASALLRLDCDVNLKWHVSPDGISTSGRKVCKDVNLAGTRLRSLTLNGETAGEEMRGYVCMCADPPHYLHILHTTSLSSADPPQAHILVCVRVCVCVQTHSVSS